MDEPNLEMSVDQPAGDNMSGDQPSSVDQSGKIIKPCKVQVIDILKQTAFPGTLQVGAESISDKPSSSSKGIEIVTDDGWIVEDDEEEIQSGSEQELDYIDIESDGEYEGDSDDWFEDTENSSDNTTQSPQKSKNEQNSETPEDDKSDAFYLNHELDDDILKQTMKVVYGVKDPKSDTLTLLKEQMEERPKLKIKLLKDLKLGNSMFQKGGRKTLYRSRRDRKQIRTDRKRVKKQVVKRQLNVSGDGIQSGQSPQGPQPQTLVGNTASVDLPGSSNIDWEPHRPLTLANATAHVAGKYPKPPLNQNISFRRILPKNQPGHFSLNGGHQIKIKAGPSNSSSKPTAQQPASDTTQGDTPKQPPQNIKFLDESLPENRAVFLPKSRTIKVPKLNPGPPGSVDVLVPVDASGQMKPPFMAIPMDTCNLVFSADGKEPTPNQSDNVPSGSSQENKADQGSHSAAQLNDRDSSTGGNTPVSGKTVQASVGTDGSLQVSSAQPQQAIQQIPQGAVLIPVSGAFPNVIPLNTPEMVRHPMLRPRVPLPPGVHPNSQYGLVPAGVFPPGIPGVFPPGVIPANLIPPLVPAGVPPVGPSMGPPCTCPPGSEFPMRPTYPQGVPQPPQAPYVHIKVEQTEETNTTNRMDPVATPDNSIGDGQSGQGIKISNVRSSAQGGHSCATDPAKRPGHSTTQPSEGANPNATSPAPGKGHPGSLVTVILPETARQYYTSPPKNLSEDMQEVQKPVTGLDLGLVWNEIKMMKSEMQYMKTVVAADMHGLRAEMAEFMKEVREKLSVLNRGQVTERESAERTGGTKRKAPDSPYRNTRGKTSL